MRDSRPGKVGFQSSNRQCVVLASVNTEFPFHGQLQAVKEGSWIQNGLEVLPSSSLHSFVSTAALCFSRLRSCKIHGPVGSGLEGTAGTAEKMEQLHLLPQSSGLLDCEPP